jgi:hypothetical protein
MVTVSILSTDDKLVVRLKHKIDYVVEKKLGSAKSFNQSNMYVFVQLFFTYTKMIFREVFIRE